MTAPNSRAAAKERRRQARLPNRLLRRARLSLLSPSGSGRPLSRQELAEAVNAHVFEHLQRVTALDGGYIAKLERGDIRWPNAHIRAGFRAVLGAGADADLGFYILRRTADDTDHLEHGQPSGDGPLPMIPAQRGGRSIPGGGHLFVSAGTAVVVLPLHHPLLPVITGERGKP